MTAIVLLVSRGQAAVTGAACVDPGPTQRSLHRYEHSVGRDVRCVVLFDDAARNWAEWSAPWFTTNPDPDSNWSAFAKAGNSLVITMSMFPGSVRGSAWRRAGASGAYDGHARQLARRLVRAGMGGSVIRLGAEANGTWFADNVGASTAQWSEWRRFWRHTAVAMRSVPGARFSFDWCIAAGPRAIPFATYYPGDDVVDSIGVDVYDQVPTSHSGDRWTYLYGRRGGVGALVRFARAHHKPLAIPEWGLERAGANGTIGSDPAFTRGVLSLLRGNRIAFESYFFRREEAATLLGDRTSLRLYRNDILK